MPFSSSAMLRLICPKRIVGSSSNYCIFGKWSASLFNRSGVRTATTAAAAAAAASDAMRNQDSSPWLMLPPELEGGMMSYKFYSLAENKVQTPSSSDAIRNLKLTCRGSSHGWLALLSPNNNGFFLYNPISRRHIKLPSILNLPKLPNDDILSSRDVSKVLLSCSPDEDEENCRAVMINGCGNALAFCWPGRSKEWTLMLDEKSKRMYDDCVYLARLKLLCVLTNDRKLETWDLVDPSSPKLIKIAELNINECYFSTSVKSFLWCLCGSVHHLVVAKDDILLVIQYIMNHVAPDGSCFDPLDERRPDNCHHMTIAFDIFKYDPKKGKFKYLDCSSLGGLALFVGRHNHSVAIQATEFPELKPNSIYFTNGYYTGTLEGGDDDEVFGVGGHDIGIFDYQNKTVSPCYYPCDAPSLKTILPAPVWFFPSRTI